MKKFFKESLAVIVIIAVCALIQILVGITWWKVVLVSMFLVGVSWLKNDYKYRSTGKVLLWIVIIAWGYHIVSVEIIDSKFSLSSKIQHRAQVNNDYEIANAINPEMILSKTALLNALNHRQDSLGILMNNALYAGNDEEAKRIMEEQIKMTKEIHLMEKAIKEVQKEGDQISGVDNINRPIPSTTGTREVVNFNQYGPSVPTTRIYLYSGQRIRVRSTQDCLIGSTNYPINANQWKQLTQAIDGHLEIMGNGKSGKIEIEVL